MIKELRLIKDHHRALVFDCDGTLADSMPVHWLAWNRTLERHGLADLFPHDRFMGEGGRPAWRIIVDLASEAGVTVDPHAIATEKRHAYIQLAAEHVRPIEPVIAIAREHRDRLPMAIATGSSRVAINHTMQAIGMVDWFDAVITADDVEHHKPHPETFLKAAEALGVAPGHCLAFEDTDIGMTAIHAAGMDAIDVRDLLTDAVEP